MVAYKENSLDSSKLVESYWRDIEHCEPLSREEEVELSRKARSGDKQARQQLIRANLRFVVKIAREYTGKGLSLMELISEGNVGLIEGVSRYDETYGTKLITYAVWWIRLAIRRALAQLSKTVSLPWGYINDRNKIERESEKLIQELGREPSFQELVDCLPLNSQQTHHALEVFQAELSLDAPLYPDGGGSEDLGSVLLVETSDVEEEFEKGMLTEIVSACLDILDQRERRIVCAYFGLEDQSSMTLEQIGRITGVTRERVRQIRNGALEKIRHHYGEQLMEFSHN
jgi:RNA polymerase primary sigma factor